MFLCIQYPVTFAFIWISGIISTTVKPFSWLHISAYEKRMLYIYWNIIISLFDSHLVVVMLPFPTLCFHNLSNRSNMKSERTVSQWIFTRYRYLYICLVYIFFCLVFWSVRLWNAQGMYAVILIGNIQQHDECNGHSHSHLHLFVAVSVTVSVYIFANCSMSLLWYDRVILTGTTDIQTNSTSIHRFEFHSKTTHTHTHSLHLGCAGRGRGNNGKCG